MCGKFCISFHILVVIFSLQLPHISCFFFNPGRKLNCFPFKLKYEEFRVDFYFSSKYQRNRLYDPNVSLERQNIDFDPRLRTTVLVHGFMGTGQDSYMQNMSDSLIEWQYSNVINVEWRKGCSNVFKYFQAAVNTEYAAMKIRKTFMNKWKNTDKSVHLWGPIHFIGHSLGAHVAGQAADLLQRRDNFTVHRVTGLDPAGPCFENEDLPLRLKKTDAKFVDVIHTDAATAVDERFGLRDSIGHVDFYVNGGCKQPGCDKRRHKRTAQIFWLILHALNNGVCHHNRALEIFTETVRQASSNGCRFWARPWNLNSTSAETKRIFRVERKSCVEMGINAENYRFESRTYYAPTTSEPPFCEKG